MPGLYTAFLLGIPYPHSEKALLVGPTAKLGDVTSFVTVSEPLCSGRHGGEASKGPAFLIKTWLSTFLKVTN